MTKQNGAYKTMNKTLKKTAAALSIASLIVVGAVSAQDAATTPEASTDTAAEVQDVRTRDQFFHDLILEYTGLDAAAFRQALIDGSTLSELIEANGQSVENFTAAVLAEYDAQVVERRLQFEENLTAMLNGEQTSLRGLGLGRGGELPGMGDFDGRGGRGGRGSMDDFGGRGGMRGAPPAAEDAPSTDTSDTADTSSAGA
ncbi:MAG: hypothetical protein IPK19_15860 [Chloroflexi bacterium]|nr:hypothetical protein [Chloroflexota bacterium]